MDVAGLILVDRQRHCWLLQDTIKAHLEASDPFPSVPSTGIDPYNETVMAVAGLILIDNH
jgi:hypothetical protein